MACLKPFTKDSLFCICTAICKKTLLYLQRFMLSNSSDFDPWISRESKV